MFPPVAASPAHEHCRQHLQGQHRAVGDGSAAQLAPEDVEALADNSGESPGRDVHAGDASLPGRA